MTLTAFKQRLFFRFSHPLGPTLLFIPWAIILIGISHSLAPRSLRSLILLFVAGLFAWTLIEYGLHRFIFHLTEIKEPWRSAASGLHMAHHRDVEVKDLIIAPPLVSVFFSIPIALLFWIVTGSFSAALLLLSGVFTGYVYYEWCHYAAHQYQVPTALGRYLKRYHLQHHFKHPNGSYGVTSPLWDYVFGSTYQAKR